jgi:GGDEF domain-containing protein
VQLAARLRQVMPEALLSRLGGDEFVLLLPGMPADAGDLAETLLEDIARSYRVALMI